MKRYVKTPTVYQMEATECGAASLSMIFAYYGKHLPLEQMREETGVSRDGCNARNMLRAARKFGLECKGYRKEPEALREIPLPCILHWNFNHFVVFEGFKGKFAYINDPALGRRKLTLQELDEGFTGIVLVFEKTDRFVREREKKTTLSFLLGRMRGEYGVLFKLIYIGFLLIFPGLVLPILSQIFFDDILGNGFRDWLTKLLVATGVSLVLKEGLTYYRNLILQKLESKMTLTSGYRFLDHMFKLSIGFFDQRYAGDLVSRMSNNTEINHFAAGEMGEWVLNLITAVFYLIVLFFYSPILTAIGLGNVAVCLISVLVSTKAIADSTNRLQMSSGKLYGAVCAGLSIMDTIKASGAETEYSNRILGHQAKMAGMEQRLNRFQQVIGLIPDVSGKITDVLILMAGGLLCIRGQMTIGMLIAFNALFDSFCDPVNQLVGFFKDFEKMKSNVKRVEDIEKYPTDPVFAGGKEKEMAAAGKLNGSVELRHVAFGYSRLKEPLICDFSFRLHSGESIAFVGPSGCGKSTVSKVISGLYAPWEGEVLFGGKRIGEIQRKSLNASIATVSQNISLFSGTVRDNLTLWNRAIPQEDIEEAARDACIHDFIMQQPGGYDYILEENAANLSGGQRQRLEIARALTGRPSILIMDEATSALDPVVEKRIMDNIRRRGCTCVIVAHRLSTIRDCNEIVVMREGKIIQRGTHESMIREDGPYRALVTGN